MRNYTHTELYSMVENGEAIDITYITFEEKLDLMNKEIFLEKIGCCIVNHSVEGYLFRGYVTRKLYAITTYSQAMYMF